MVSRYHLAIGMPLEISSNEGIKRLVAGGARHLDHVAKRSGGEEIQAGKLVAIPLTGGTIRRKFFMVYHKDKYFSEALQKFVDCVYQWG